MGHETELLDRITVRTDVFGGKPIIRDMRFAVEHMLELLAAGDTAETILREYPFLEPEDIQACAMFAGATTVVTRCWRTGAADGGVRAPDCRASRTPDPHGRDTACGLR